MNETYKENPLIISDEAELDRPPNRHIMPLEWRDWSKIKKGVSRIKNPSNFWENAIWAFAAFSFALALQYIVEYGKQLPNTNKGVFLFVGSISCLVVAILCYVFSRENSNALRESRNTVIEDMSEIEEYIKKAQSQSTESQANPHQDELIILLAEYGTEGKFLDAKNNIISFIDNNSVSIGVTNENMGGDPNVGKIKFLNIKYRYNGENFEKRVEENKDLIIP